jgi:hypothetical protein
MTLKSQCLESFDFRFFHQTASLAPLRSTRGRFRYFAHFHNVIWRKVHRGVSTPRCRQLSNQQRNSTALKATIHNKTDHRRNLGDCKARWGVIFWKISFWLTPRCKFHRGVDFKFQKLHEKWSKNKIDLKDLQ